MRKVSGLLAKHRLVASDEYEASEVKVDFFAKKIHPDYDDYTLSNDVCILKTKSKFDLNLNQFILFIL